VFLEIGRPGADGIMLLTYLREVDPGVPVLVVTANTSSTVAAECVKAGAFGYVPKPLNLVYMDHMVALAADQLVGRRAG
jgi:DNA-binding NtrC family response regulator